MTWALYALLHSLCRAFFVETNRVYKIDSWQLTFMQALFGLVALLPFIPLMDWPDDPRFYFAGVVVALITAVGYMIQLGLAAQKTGRVSGMYMPLEALTATIVWVLVMPAVMELHLQNIMLSLGVAVALGLSTFGMARIRQSDVSWSTFLVVAPVGATYAVSGIATKIVMPETNIIPTVLAYSFVGFATMTLVLGVVLLARKKFSRDMIAKPSLRGGFLTGTFSVVGSLCFVAAVAMAPNPGYVSIMAMMLPVWLMLFHKAMGVEDRATPWAAGLLISGVILLIGVTAVF